MANKRRCGGCKDYFRPQEMYKSSGVQAFCTVDCMTSKQPKRKKKSKDIPKAVRDEVFKRFKHKCAYCGRSHGLLAPHHIKYRSEGVDHSLGNLVLLCQEHHAMVHADKKKWQPILMDYIFRIEQRERVSLPVLELEWKKENEEL